MLIFQIFMIQIVSAYLKNFMKSEITQSIVKKDVFICTFTVTSNAAQDTKICRIRAKSDEPRRTFAWVRRTFTRVRRKYIFGEQLANTLYSENGRICLWLRRTRVLQLWCLKYLKCLKYFISTDLICRSFLVYS